VLNIIVLMNNS